MKRRDFIKIAGMAGAGIALMPGGFVRRGLQAAPARAGLSDPALQPKFVNLVPDAMAPGFIYKPDKKGRYKIKIGTAVQQTGLRANGTGPLLNTPVWGYGDQKDKLITWPGRTFEIQNVLAGGPPETEVIWANALNGVTHLLPVDTNLHWCYSLHGYTKYTIANAGVPIITHLHGGHTDFQFDGNPEFFYSPEIKNKQVVGPQWANVPGGFTTKFRYDNNVPAGNLWYHDHALGITRLNVYAGMAGFYFVRDNDDTGKPGNPLGLAAWPYEKAYAIQDRMFLDTGELFYPTFPGDPFYDDFITGEGAILPPDLFPGGGPTALAEFFGDHMVVNGLIWPKEDVEPRNYRLHLLNGTDSRFMAIQFFEVPPGEEDFSNAINGPLDFTVVGSDQGLASSPTTVQTLLSEPGSRYDIVFDFNTVTFGNRVIMKNIGGDEPFGGDIPGPQVFGETDRIMAFDVNLPLYTLSNELDVSPTGINFGPNVGTPTRTRKVALFEGKAEFGRLQPLLGTAEPATDESDASINWPNTPVYSQATLPDGTPSPLTGQMEGSIAWHSPTTENPALPSTEKWEIWNVTGDAHPVHLHLVHFEVLEREDIVWDSNTIVAGDILLDGSTATEDDETRVIPNAKAVASAGDGTYLVTQPTVQHNSVAGVANTYGVGFKIMGHTTSGSPSTTPPPGYVENTPKDMVTALPDQVTRIKATFDKPGRYVWHCHILSHEDHEMMRVLHVGTGAFAKDGVTDATAAVPKKFTLEQNYPNPFNPSTNIRFQLPQDERVELKIYNMLGQEVRTLANEKYTAGQHTLVWDGKNNHGKAVASGIYVYKMTAGKFTRTKKMNLVR
jgi:FtsP/CotA-like multicopper oxidase with cupredoxin domain